MDVEKDVERLWREVWSLRGENIALQSVTVFALLGLVRLGEPFKALVTEAFDYADTAFESGAMKIGSAGSQIHTESFSRVLEQLRDIVLGGNGQPKDAV